MDEELKAIVQRMIDAKETEANIAKVIGAWEPKKSNGASTKGSKNISVTSTEPSQPFQWGNEAITNSVKQEYAPTPLNKPAREKYIKEKKAVQNKESDKLSEQLYAYDKVHGAGATSNTQQIAADKQPDTIQATPSEWNRFKSSVSNSVDNLGTNIEKTIPNLSLVSSTLITKAIGKDAADWLNKYRVEFDSNGVNLITGETVEETQQKALTELQELNAQTKNSAPLVGVNPFTDPLRTASGIVDAVSSLGGTALTSSLSGGSLLLTDMVGNSLYDFNKAKADKLGITVNELFKDRFGCFT